MTTTLTADEVAILLSAAGAAPSMHNTQPWAFIIDGVAIDVRLDEGRALPAEDPTGRWMRIGLGAAAFNLRVAAAVLDHASTVVTDPDRARPDIIARLFLDRRGTGDRELGGLYAQVHRRRTHRGPMSDTEIDPRVWSMLKDAARVEGAELIGLGAGQVDQILGLVVEAEVLDNTDQSRREELAGWVGTGRVHDGVPLASLGPRPDTFPLAYRDLGAGLAEDSRPGAVFEGTSALAVLATHDDGPGQWLRAGMALERVLLVASSVGVSASFVNQPLEHPEQRGYVRTIAAAGSPQQIIRLGYPVAAGSRTPRRPWRELRQQ